MDIAQVVAITEAFLAARHSSPESFGLTFLGSGIYRSAYRIGDLVVKIATGDKGSQGCNATEWKVWTHYQDTEVAHHLAPCLYLDGKYRFVIQEYAGRTLWEWDESVDKVECYEVQNEVLLALAELGVATYDVHVGNITERRKVIDYGSFPTNYLPVVSEKMQVEKTQVEKTQVGRPEKTQVGKIEILRRVDSLYAMDTDARREQAVDWAKALRDAMKSYIHYV